MGDSVLLHIAESMLAHSRPMERIFRWGGEEFIVLLPGVDAEEAHLAAERLRRYVESSPYTAGDVKIRNTISIGLYTGDGSDSLNHALGVADRNLYKAKETGRNRVIG